MMADASDKSVVVWWPNLHLGVPDPAEWGSLCLWYDKVFLCPPDMYLVSHAQGDKTGLSVGRQLGYDKHLLDSLRSVVEETSAFRNTITQMSEAGIIQFFDFRALDLNREAMMHLPAWFWEWIGEPIPTEGTDSGTLYRRIAGGLYEEAYINDISHIIFCLQRKFPLYTSNNTTTRSTAMETIERLSTTLATTAISQLALPQVRPAHVDDLLEARTALKDELLEFRAGILNLTWLLHQQVKGTNDLSEIRQEADMLVNTKIRAAVLLLEHRMQQHENKRIRRMLFGTGRVLVDAAKMFLPGGWQEKLVAGGKALLQTATEIDSAKPPEDQIATYLYKLKRHLKS